MDRELLRIGFDADWYVRAYPDVASAGVPPLRHFVRHGRAEGRDPGPWLRSDWYLQGNPEAAAAHVPAFDHFAAVGVLQARPPHPDVVDHPLWRRVVGADPTQRRAVFLEVLPALASSLDDGGAPPHRMVVPLDAMRWERVLRAGAAGSGGARP